MWPRWSTHVARTPGLRPSRPVVDRMRSSRYGEASPWGIHLAPKLMPALRLAQVQRRASRGVAGRLSSRSPATGRRRDRRRVLASSDWRLDGKGTAAGAGSTQGSLEAGEGGPSLPGCDRREVGNALRLGFRGRRERVAPYGRGRVTCARRRRARDEEEPEREQAPLKLAVLASPASFDAARRRHHAR